MLPKIDYQLLGEAINEYDKRGYQYVEVPWFVTLETVRATLPEQYEPLRLGMDYGDVGFGSFICQDCLVGSAEQAFLTKKLAPGAYIGVTPCFRAEPEIGLMNQIGFMKAELFVIPPVDHCYQITLERVITDAQEVMAFFGGVRPAAVETEEGFDLELGGIEVGSYGIRSTSQHGTWVYGTGLALPRFSVANAISGVI